MSNISKEDYDLLSSRGIIVEASCKCRDEKGRAIPYTYAPKNYDFGFKPEGWFCPICGKGHLGLICGTTIHQNFIIQKKKRPRYQGL